jgi:glycerol-3-phosphate acyltransferase PlsY
MKIILVLIVSYLAGSIPTGLLIAKARGVDLRKVGSRNIGATNVLRSVGKTEAIQTLLGDMLKGAFAVALMKLTGYNDGPYLFLAGLFAVIGHTYPVYLGFRGGKGVATSLGFLLVYSPDLGLATIILWIIVATLSRYSSLAALIAFVLLPINMLLFKKSVTEFLLSTFLVFLIYLKHKDNIKRLLEGKESRIFNR